MPEATIEALLAEGRTFPPPPEFKKTARIVDGNATSADIADGSRGLNPDFAAGSVPRLDVSYLIAKFVSNEA